MKLLNDRYKGARCQLKEAVAFFHIVGFLAIVARVDGFVPFRPLDDGAQLLNVEEVIDSISGGRHFCGGYAESDS